MNEDAESFTTVEESVPSKKIYKKDQAAVKQKSVPLKKVNQTEIMGTSLTL